MRFNKKHLSPLAITNELQQAIKELPDSEAWADYFEGGAGRTIIELIAGSQAIKNHYNLMRVRESSIQFAKLDSSVTELAINKGVYRPPAKSFIIEVGFIPFTSGVLNRGEIVGNYKDYDIIVLKSTKYELGSLAKVVCTVGKLTTFTKEITSTKSFEEIIVKSPYKYISEEFQILSINDEIVNLIDEQVNLYDPILPNTCLRLVYEYTAKLIFGDDVLGKMLKSNDIVKYTFSSFGDNVFENLSIDLFSFNYLRSIGEIQHVDILRKPSRYLDKEILRKIAIRNSVDGRWVQVNDYKNGILREYGEYLYDVLVADEYPAENITILPKEDMLTDHLKEEIAELINNKRGNATLINLNWLDPEDEENRLSLKFSMEYVGSDDDETLRKIIDDYIKKRINKIYFEGYWLTGADIAVDLTELAPGGKFYGSLDEKVYIKPLQSIRELSILYGRI